MQISQIQIRLQHAKLQIDADIGKQELQQPQATVEMERIRPVQHFSTSRGQLDINQDLAWDALGLGDNLKTLSKMYSMSSEIALRGLARIIENGNRMADIHLGGNPIADISSDWQRTYPELDFRGEASYDNVEITYTPGELSIETTPGRININVEVNRPIHHYERGKLDIYMSQYPKVEILPPQINELI